MEKSGKHEATPKKRRSGHGTTSEDRRSHTSSPRSKVKTPQAGFAERRYKDMLHTTSHIYQTQTTSGVTDALEEPPISNETLPYTKDTIPVRQKRSLSAGSVLPEGITTDVPLTEIMSREKPTSIPINSEISENCDPEGTSKNPPEKSAESSVQQIPMENNVVNHEDQNDCFVTGEPTCRKHSSAHIDGKQKALIGRPKLCDSCTISMLSYIAMLRDMLDEVTNEITNQEDQTVQCAECIKERVMQRNQIRSSTVRTSADSETVSSKKGASPSTVRTSADASQRPRDLPLTKQTAEHPLSEHRAPAGDTSGDGQQGLQQKEKSGHDAHQPSQQETSVIQQQQRMQISPVEKSDSIQTTAPSYQTSRDFPTSAQYVPKNQAAFAQPETGSEQQKGTDERTGYFDAETPRPAGQAGSMTSLLDMFGEDQRRDVGGTRQQSRRQPVEGETRVMDHSEAPAYISQQNGAFFDETFEPSGDTPGQRPSCYPDEGDDHTRKMPSASAHKDFHPQISPFLRDHGESDGILSALSNEEREVYDSARGGAGWERLADTQDYRDTSFGPSSTQEAFVTMATTNAEAISCLVLGSSLLLCRTTKTVCVLITDGVSPSLRAPLASVFQVVQSVRSLDTVGTTKVALLDQPDLGIFFRKLHAWRLVQFSKCVFLNPDTLVIQNSDELFCHDELSAVPDIGWPDCFNSGVFVFQPSIETFWKLVEFAESEGSYDGGDQGLLNAFFKDWSKDIHKKLSFIYNLMANVSYTYTPAFRQFGRNVKIVQFQGPFKPWHVKFYTGTGQIAPSTAVHPTYVQFVHVWLNIFRVRVLPLFSQDIQSFASSQNIISASELLKFYPSPTEIEADFLLTPPSVRLRPDPLGTPKQSSIMRRHSIGSYKELKPAASESDSPREHFDHKEPAPSQDKGDEPQTEIIDVTSKCKDEDNPETEERPTTDKEGPQSAVEEQQTLAHQELDTTQKDAPVESTEDDGSRRASIPGSEIGDYHGMAAWEQGRMDYMGSDCSENIIKRLHFLMDKSSDTERPE